MVVYGANTTKKEETSYKLIALNKYTTQKEAAQYKMVVLTSNTTKCESCHYSNAITLNVLLPPLIWVNIFAAEETNFSASATDIEGFKYTI